MALGLEGLDWVSGLTFPGNPTRLKHSNCAKALNHWRGSGKITLDGEQESKALLKWGGYIPFLSLTPTPALTPETPLTLDMAFYSIIKEFTWGSSLVGEFYAKV